MPREISTTPARIIANLETIRKQMGEVCAKAGRAEDAVNLVAVTKYVGPEAIRVLLENGVRHLAENRVQAFRPKREALQSDVATHKAQWRFIGHLQTNKIKYVVPEFAAIDAVDSIRLLEAIAKEAGKRGRAPYDCLVEVNVSGEGQKYGISPGDVEAFLQQASKISECEIAGLMAMAPYSDDPESISRPVFRQLNELHQEANSKNWYRAPLKELSMGMSSDFTIAIEEGATAVRVGSALFE